MFPDTIVAAATPPGRGGIGIVRLSGTLVPDIARAMIGELPAPRVASRREFRAANGELLDSGLSTDAPPELRVNATAWRVTWSRCINGRSIVSGTMHAEPRRPRTAETSPSPVRALRERRRRLAAIPRYERYIAEAAGDLGLQSSWRNLRRQDIEDAQRMENRLALETAHGDR